MDDGAARRDARGMPGQRAAYFFLGTISGCALFALVSVAARDCMDSRERRKEEFYEQQLGPCGAKIEMINMDGDSRSFCERDVHGAEGMGWVVRHQERPR